MRSARSTGSPGSGSGRSSPKPCPSCATRPDPRTSGTTSTYQLAVVPAERRPGDRRQQAHPPPGGTDVQALGVVNLLPHPLDGRLDLPAADKVILGHAPS